MEPTGSARGFRVRSSSTVAGGQSGAYGSSAAGGRPADPGASQLDDRSTAGTDASGPRCRRRACCATHCFALHPLQLALANVLDLRRRVAQVVGGIADDAGGAGKEQRARAAVRVPSTRPGRSPRSPRQSCRRCWRMGERRRSN